MPNIKVNHRSIEFRSPLRCVARPASELRQRTSDLMRHMIPFTDSIFSK